MKIHTLKIEDREDLLEAINTAFADYIVPYQLNKEQLMAKIASENIQMEKSVGVFEEGSLIAFMMHGVREQDGHTVIYNAGTGVLPEYRGQGLVSKMYDYILPYLKECQVKKIVLEVIETNQSAIRAYEKNGFSVKRKLLCFAGKIQTNTMSNIASIQVIDNFSFDVFESFWDVRPSWQSDSPSMDVLKPEALGAFVNNELIGYLLFNPANRRLYQIAIIPTYRRKGIGTQLLARIQQQIAEEKVQFNNVDEGAENLKLFLEKQGLIHVINQLEMIKML